LINKRYPAARLKLQAQLAAHLDLTSSRPNGSVACSSSSATHYFYLAIRLLVFTRSLAHTDRFNFVVAAEGGHRPAPGNCQWYPAKAIKKVTSYSTQFYDSRTYNMVWCMAYPVCSSSEIFCVCIFGIVFGGRTEQLHIWQRKPPALSTFGIGHA
jgi:hypothetical protein